MEQMREEHNVRAEAIDFYRPDVEALVETWLEGEEEIVVDGYAVWPEILTGRYFGRLLKL